MLTFEKIRNGLQQIHSKLDLHFQKSLKVTKCIHMQTISYILSLEDILAGICHWKNELRAHDVEVQSRGLPKQVLIQNMTAKLLKLNRSLQTTFPYKKMTWWAACTFLVPEKAIDTASTPCCLTYVELFVWGMLAAYMVSSVSHSETRVKKEVYWQLLSIRDVLCENRSDKIFCTYSIYLLLVWHLPMHQIQWR